MPVFLPVKSVRLPFAMHRGKAKELLETFKRRIELAENDTTFVVKNDTQPFIQTERDALEAIFKACGGEEWLNRGRWCTQAPLNVWHGVVMEDGRVIRLFLRDNNLRGELPDIFAKLPKLKQLYLSGNELCGSIPISVGGLSDLTTLDMSKNMLSGSVPRAMGGLFSLQRLLLDHNELSGDLPSTLACLTNLKWVDFRENAFEKKELPAMLDFIPVRRPIDSMKF